MENDREVSITGLKFSRKRCNSPCDVWSLQGIDWSLRVETEVASEWIEAMRVSSGVVVATEK